MLKMLETYHVVERGQPKALKTQCAVQRAVQGLPEIHPEVETVPEVVISPRNQPTVEAMRMTTNFRLFSRVPLAR